MGKQRNRPRKIWSFDIFALFIVVATGCHEQKHELVGDAGRPIEPVDIRSVDPDLQIPALHAGPAAAGRRIKEVLPNYEDTTVYHTTYLPTDWTPNGNYPVIVELGGNGNYSDRYGDTCDGKVESCKLGYGMSGGSGFIWICLPFLNNTGDANSIVWWGDRPKFDPQPTIHYCKKAIPWICQKYGGNPHRIVLTGFSRGSIACNFIGLYDDEIAKLWCASVPYSHYDGVIESWGYPGGDRASAATRLKRLGNRPQFICSEFSDRDGSIESTRRYLESTNHRGQFTFKQTGFRNHNDAWILRPSPARTELRHWLQKIVDH